MILCGHIKILCDIEGHFDLLGYLHGKCIFSLLFDLSIHNSVNSWPNHFKCSTVVVVRGTSGCKYDTSSISLNWDISIINCRMELKSALAKWDWRRASVFKHDICDMINLVLNKMEETFQSNTLDWSSLVLSFFFSTATCVLRFLHYFSTNLDEIWHVDSP